jgi:hypothetical protein
VSVPRLPRVVSPVTTLFTRDGIEVALVSVELWPQHLVVRLAAIPNEITADRQRRYEMELERWGEAASGDPPEQPGTRLLAALRLAVEDDVGTAYAPRSSNTGGTGSEWHGDWFFAAEVPESVGRLTIRVAVTDGKAATVDLDLTNPPEP